MRPAKTPTTHGRDHGNNPACTGSTQQNKHAETATECTRRFEIAEPCHRDLRYLKAHASATAPASPISFPLKCNAVTCPDTCIKVKHRRTTPQSTPSLERGSADDIKGKDAINS